MNMLSHNNLNLALLIYDQSPYFAPTAQEKKVLVFLLQFYLNSIYM